MQPDSRRSSGAWLQRRVAPLLLAGMLTLDALGAGAVALFLQTSRRHYEQDVETATRNLAALLDQAITSDAARVDLTLRDVVDALQQQLAARGRIDPANANAILHAQRLRLPDGAGIRVCDAEGRVILGTNVDPKARLSWAERPFFAPLRARADAGLSVTGPIYGRIPKTWIIPFARRYTAPDGRFAGVIVAGVPVDFLGRLLSAPDVGPHGVALVRDADGTLIARYPASTQPVQAPGSRVYSPELHAAIASGRPVTTFHTAAGGDGLERISTYRRLQAVPFHLVVGMATVDYLQPWYREVRWTLGALAGYMLLTALAAWLLWRYMNRARMEALRNQAMLHAASDGMHIIDESGRIVEVSDQFCAMLGYTRAEMLGMHVSAWDAGLDSTGIDAMLREQFAQRGRILFETRHRRRDGSVFDVEVSGLALRIQGQLLLFNTSRDITQRNALQGGLQRLARFNALLADVQQHGVDCADAAALFDAACRAALERAGLPAAWIVRPAADGSLDVLATAGSGELHADSARRAWRTHQPVWSATAQAALPIDAQAHPQALACVQLDAAALQDPGTRELLRQFAHGIGRGLENLAQRRRIADLQRLYQALMNEGEVVLQSRSVEEMLARTCERLVHETTFCAAWMAQPDADGWVRPLARAGGGVELLDALRINVHDTGHAPPLVRAWRSGELVFSNDTLTNPDMAPWHAQLVASGWHAVLAAPVRRAGRTWALLVFFSAQREVFDEQTVRLCRRIAELLGHGLDELDLKQRLADMQREESHRARHDVLTGLPNRFALAQHLHEALARAGRHDEALAVGLIDLDDFKPVNDRWGHQAGDQLLRELASRLRAQLREGDLLARLGGDEFVVVFEGLDPRHPSAQLHAALERLHRAVETPFELGPEARAEVAMTMGLALYPNDGNDGDSLLRQADAAMYQAKLQKTNRASWWRLGAAPPEQPEPAAAFDAYGERAAELLDKAAPVFEASATEFVDAFYAGLDERAVPRAVLEALGPDGIARLKRQQAAFLRLLVAPGTTREQLAEAARRAGTAHALVGITGALLTEALALYRHLIGEHLNRSAMTSRDRYQIALTLETRLQDDIQAELDAQQNTIDAYLQALARPHPRGGMWYDLAPLELAALAALPGVVGCEVLRPNPQGEFQIEASAGGAAEGLRRLGAHTDFRALLDTREPGGRGVIAQAWRSGQITRLATCRDDPRAAPWHDAMRELGIRSTLAIPVPGAPTHTALVLVLHGAFPHQFETPWMRQFAANLQQRWAGIWQSCTTASAVPSVPQELAQAWREQLLAGGLRMAMQPVFDLETGAPVRVEALARLHMPDGKVIQPGAFLPVLGAAELDRLFRLGLELALEQLERWDAQGLRLDISINLSPTTLLDADCPQWVEEALRRHRIAPRRLTLELLETHNIDTALQDECIDRLGRLGVKLAMDDLGSGYSSLQRLSSMHFDTIKVDQSLLRNLRANPLRTLGLISTIVQMGRDFEREVVVEGLEDPGMVEAAAVLGAGFGQGYGLARPMPAEDVTVWCDQRHWTPRRAGIETFLGALAYHWTYMHQVHIATESDPAECPLGVFLRARGLHHGEVAEWHRQVHEGTQAKEASRRLTEWLVQRVQLDAAAAVGAA